jgi:glycosyltransferase involved in cell wall biosynthesis
MDGHPENRMMKSAWTPRPLVTALMCVYNTPPGYLRTAAISILEQSHDDFEFLIIDDGSTNSATKEELCRLAAEDRRIRLLHHSNIGLTRSLNRGLELAQGEWVARQDSDDWSEPDRLARQLEFLQVHPDVDLCGSNAWTHQESGRPLWSTQLPEQHQDILASFEQRNPFVHGSVLFRASRARQLGGYREQFRCSQDFDFFWRFAESTRVANLPSALYHYRYTGGSVSATKAAAQAIAHRAAYKLAAARRSGAHEDVQAAFEEAQKEMTSETAHKAALKQADHRLLAGDYIAAGRAFRMLLFDRPWSVIGWAKCARWVVFRAAPSLRQECFR